ncbi:two-component sensor histidine kinase [Actinorhabdospora filicis]|uniref:histidine kinase n=1 Tax=Actinorhabdospora filicis TaxID=1785913 RepID=A0A9W6SPX5_9ACTN|nr:histidine kinase [Actinorhabdospora filicis]GLZ80815.1 two-component sensor histidine kinase [Actinorhabdospora filicis]
MSRTLRADAAIAAVIAAASCLAQAPAAANQGLRFDDPRGYALIAATALCLTVRRTHPMACVIAVLAGTHAYLLAGFPYGPALVPAMVALGTFAFLRPWRHTAVVAAASYAVGALSTFEPLAPAIWLIPPAATGLALATVRDTRRRAADRDRELHLARERLRIAREVHDAVGHGLAVITMHAGVALHVIERRGAATPTEVAESLRAIRDSGRAGLAELTSAIAPLTGSPPGLSALPALLARMPIPVSLEAAPGEPPSTVDRVAYRIAQEALTNVIRHARATRAHVAIGAADGVLTLSIVDDGTAPPGPEGAGRAGMRERAELLGGTLTSGSEPGGGFAVRARLPYGSLEP